MLLNVKNRIIIWYYESGRIFAVQITINVRNISNWSKFIITILLFTVSIGLKLNTCHAYFRCYYHKYVLQDLDTISALWQADWVARVTWQPEIDLCQIAAEMGARNRRDLLREYLDWNPTQRVQAQIGYEEWLKYKDSSNKVINVWHVGYS